MATRPNVLLVCTDEQRPGWLSMNDVPVRTANVAALADRGVWFSDAVCPAPVCNPSRACLAQGTEYDRCGVPSNQIDCPRDRPLLYDRLRDDADYHVMGCGKFDLATNYPFGLTGSDGTESWGFSDARFNPPKSGTAGNVWTTADYSPQDPYTAYLEAEGLLEIHVNDYQRRNASSGPHYVTATFPTPLPQEAYYDEWITRQALDLLSRAPADRPWFIQVNLQNPHGPRDVTEQMHDWYRDPPVDLPDPIHGDPAVDDATHAEHADSCLGRLVDAVDEEETVVIYMSDHGELLGDHRGWFKTTPYRQSAGVPFVMAGPGIDTRGRDDTPVTTLDVHATILELAGLDPGSAPDSRSMIDYLAGDTDRHRDVVYSGVGSWRMVYDGRYKLVRGYDPVPNFGPDQEKRAIGPEETERRLRERAPLLFDLETDPGEQENVADDHPDRVADLSRRLADIRRGAV